jgi:hypothetical protein
MKDGFKKKRKKLLIDKKLNKMPAAKIEKKLVEEDIINEK